jgi:hypothetical protein
LYVKVHITALAMAPLWPRLTLIEELDDEDEEEQLTLVVAIAATWP